MNPELKKALEDLKVLTKKRTKEVKKLIEAIEPEEDEGQDDRMSGDEEEKFAQDLNAKLHTLAFGLLQKHGFNFSKDRLANDAHNSSLVLKNSTVIT